MRKPKTPLRHTVTAQRPFLRFIGRNNVSDVAPFIAEWAPTIAGWLKAGLEPFVFTHAPDDRFAPPLARALHEAVRQHFPDWNPATVARRKARPRRSTIDAVLDLRFLIEIQLPFYAKSDHLCSYGS